MEIFPKTVVGQARRDKELSLLKIDDHRQLQELSGFVLKTAELSTRAVYPVKVAYNSLRHRFSGENPTPPTSTAKV